MQHWAKQRRETGLDMRDMQSCANPSNAYWLTRNEQVSGSSPLVGSLDSAYLSGMIGMREAPSSSSGAF